MVIDDWRQIKLTTIVGPTCSNAWVVVALKGNFAIKPVTWSMERYHAPREGRDRGMNPDLREAF